MTTQEIEEKTSGSSRAVSATIIAVLSICPFFFYSIVKRNEKNLDKPAIKAKIGTLYVGLNAKKVTVRSHAPTFLLRRSIFCCITFFLFNQPGL